MNIEHERILVTGGTGSFGKKFVEKLLRRYPNCPRLVIFSRDELKQFEMAEQYPESRYPNVRFFIGDIRDKDRIRLALEGIDTVIHAAALKQVATAEYNPFECIKTNVLGAQNLIEAVFDSQVRRVIALSTDKAAAPVNLYGATKLCSDKLFVAANNMRGHRDLRFSVVRYGNVMGSRGSVIPFFLRRRKTGLLPITDPNMTRFNISLEDGVDLVLDVLVGALRGEIIVPKLPSYRIMDVAKAIGPECETEVVGIRPGEKVHEEMITVSDSSNTIETDRYYVIVPWLNDRSWEEAMKLYMEHYNAKRTLPGFRYSSESNHWWLSVEEIRELIRRHVDANFKV